MSGSKILVVFLKIIDTTASKGGYVSALYAEN